MIWISNCKNDGFPTVKTSQVRSNEKTTIHSRDKIPATFEFKSPTFLLLLLKNYVSTQHEITLSSSSSSWEHFNPFSFVPRTHLFQDLNTKAISSFKERTIFPYSLPFPTTIFTAPPRFATAGSRFTFAAARFDFSSSSVPTPPRRTPTLPLLLPLLSSPIKARHHSSIDLHCRNKLPIFRSSLRHDLQSSPRSSTLVVVALDAAFILDLLGHWTPPLLLVSSILLLLLPVPNLTAVDTRHRFKFQFFWLFLRRNLLPLFLPKPTGRFPTFQSLLHLKGSISSIVGSAIPIFDLGCSYSVIHHRRLMKDRRCCLSRRHHGKARSPHSTLCLRLDRFSNSA